QESRMSKGKFLKKDSLTPELLDNLKRLDGIAKSRNETLAEMALAWILHQKGVTSVLVGASSTEQLQKNLKSINAEPFTDKDV
ncbi:MAG TPA: aldo/keto reductase, partial [Xylanibacter oryzae]|nr:aldo/keto reductase [Xylanibacter oryzae]